MRGNWAALILLAIGLAFALPGNARRAAADVSFDDADVLKVSIAFPRASEPVRSLRQIDEALKEATEGRWRIKIYPQGVSGDERDVVRKMRVGACVDAAVLTPMGLSEIVKELSVLDAPGVLESYEHGERVLTLLGDAWSKKLEAEGFYVWGWSELGMLRYFSKAPLHSLADLKSQRLWVWPYSQTMKAMWRALGGEGVPLGYAEVEGGLRTGMINAAMGTSIAAEAMKWSPMLTHVTQRTQGPLISSFVLAKAACSQLPDDVREILKPLVERHFVGDKLNIRKDDERAYKALLKRGYVSVGFTDEGEAHYQAVAKQARESLIGQMYSRELLDKVMSAARAADTRP